MGKDTWPLMRGSGPPGGWAPQPPAGVPAQPPVRAPLYAVLTGGAYGVLAVVGALVGLVGCFCYSWSLGPVPIAAIALVGGNFGALLAAGRAMGGRLGAAVPAVGWAAVVVLLQGRRPEGDLVITGDLAGYFFVVGGTVAAGVAIKFTRSSGAWLLAGAQPRPK